LIEFLGVYLMKAFIRSRVGRMPEGAYHRALKAEAEVLDGDIGDLLYDLAIHRYVLQRLWMRYGI